MTRTLGDRPDSPYLRRRRHARPTVSRLFAGWTKAAFNVLNEEFGLPQGGTTCLLTELNCFELVPAFEGLQHFGF